MTIVVAGEPGRVSTAESPPARWRRFAYGAPAVSALGIGVVLISVGAFQKASCLIRPRSSCYSDVAYLWQVRDLASHALPYVHGGMHGINFVGHEFEYPVLTGIFAWLCSLPVHSLAGFVMVSIVALAPFGLLSTWLLGRLAGRRALLFAAAPTLIWYSFLNWDLIGVATALAGIYAWSRDRYWLSAGFLAVGACFKLWPGFLLIPLALELLCRRRSRDVAGTLAVAATVIAAVNAPFVAVNFAGWKAPYLYQELRPVNVFANNLWTVLIPSIGRVSAVNHVSEAACAAAWLLVLMAAVRRYRAEGVFPFLQVSAAMVATFVALGKVHSPQYALWVLPFFALLRISRPWWLAFVLSDFWLFAQFSFLSPARPLWHTSAVLLSDAVLLGLAWVAMRAEPALVPVATARPCGSSRPTWTATRAVPGSRRPRS